MNQSLIVLKFDITADGKHTVKTGGILRLVYYLRKNICHKDFKMIITIQHPSYAKNTDVFVHDNAFIETKVKIYGK